MHDCMRGRCGDKSVGSGCGDAVSAQLFFISFNIIGSFVMTNLFIAVYSYRPIQLWLI